MLLKNTDQSTEKSPDSKVISTVLIFVALALSIVLISYFGNKVTNGAKAYVAGEGFWTKAQKEAVLHLVHYLNFEEDKDYKNFEQALQVNEGDEKARVTLLSDKPDYETAYQGFLQGKNHPDDIPDMIWLFNNFQNVSYINKAIDIWTEGDTKIEELDNLAQVIRASIQEGDLSARAKNLYLNEIYALDDELTTLENDFSRQMGQAARWANSTIFWLTVMIVLTLVLIAGITTVRNLQNISSINKRLNNTQRKFRNVLDNSRDIIYQMELDTGQYVYMSPSVSDILGYTVEEMLEKGQEFVIEIMHPEDQKRMEDELAEYNKDDLKNHFSKDSEFRIKTSEGKYIWISNKRALLYNKQGEPSEIVGSVRDITDRKKYEEELDRSLQEKEILLQEIHHRVKNNLAIIISLLELQKDELDEDMRDAFQESQARIQSIALVHEKLYQTETLSNIALAGYIRELTKVISSTYYTEHRNLTTRLTLDEENINLDINQAIPVGLIYNELVNNAYKHGFAGNEEGILKVKLNYDGAKIALTVADNGNGLPDDFDIEGTGSLGMTLIKTLCQQLGAELAIASDEWTSFKISFAPQ